MAQADGGFPARELALRDMLIKEGLAISGNDKDGARTGVSMTVGGKKRRVLRLKRDALDIA